MNSYDFIILGAGSAGCVLANRLSQNPDVNVCLIEAGSKDNDPRLHIPIGFAFLGDKTKYSWSYDTVPQKEFEKVPVAEPESVAVDSAGGVHKMPSESTEHRKGFGNLPLAGSQNAQGDDDAIIEGKPDFLLNTILMR